MKFEKIVKTFVIATVMTGSVFTFSQTTEAATVSIEKAAQKIYKAEAKAYNTKKDTSVTVKIAAPSKAKKAISKVTGELEDALIKEELGDVDLTYVLRGKYVRPAIGLIIKRIGTLSSEKADKDFYFYFPAGHGADQTASYKNGVLTIKLDIQGSKKWYRDQYNENTYLAKCVEELRELTDGLSEKDKAWRVAQWVNYWDYKDGDGHPRGHFGYDGEETANTKYSMFWKRAARGVCEQEAIANQFFGCLMGLNVGFVDDPIGDGHAWNCVKIDGEIYYFDGTGSETGDWDAMTLDAEKYAKHCSIAKIKEWVDGTSIGEWCLLTQDEFTQVYDSYYGWDISRWSIYWKLGNRFEGRTQDLSKVQQL